MPKETFVSVQVKLGHPTGTYRRSGHVFYVAEPVILPAGDVTPEMQADEWLIIQPASGPDAAADVSTETPSGAQLAEGQRAIEAIARFQERFSVHPDEVTAVTIDVPSGDAGADPATVVNAEGQTTATTGDVPSEAPATHSSHTIPDPADEKPSPHRHSKASEAEA